LPDQSERVSYLDLRVFFVFTVSVTVVLGFFAAVDFLTNRPLIADLGTLRVGIEASPPSFRILYSTRHRQRWTRDNAQARLVQILEPVDAA